MNEYKGKHILLSVDFAKTNRQELIVIKTLKNDEVVNVTPSRIILTVEPAMQDVYFCIGDKRVSYYRTVRNGKVSEMKTGYENGLWLDTTLGDLKKYIDSNI